jgi:hypothetical protein
MSMVASRVWCAYCAHTRHDHEVGRVKDHEYAPAGPSEGPFRLTRGGNRDGHQTFSIYSNYGNLVAHISPGITTDLITSIAEANALQFLAVPEYRALAEAVTACAGLTSPELEAYVVRTLLPDARAVLAAAHGNGTLLADASRVMVAEDHLHAAVRLLREASTREGAPEGTEDALASTTAAIIALGGMTEEPPKVLVWACGSQNYAVPHAFEQDDECPPPDGARAICGVRLNARMGANQKVGGACWGTKRPGEVCKRCAAVLCAREERNALPRR